MNENALTRYAVHCILEGEMIIIRDKLDHITFAVDEVEPATVPLPTTSAMEMSERRFGQRAAVCWEPGRRVVGSPDRSVLSEQGDIHPLVGAVHLAFSEHRPLILGPDAVWLTIAQGVAQHVNSHAETLRSDLVRHRGKKVLRIPIQESPRTIHQWAALIDNFSSHLQEQHPELAALVRCDYSTTTPGERLASQVVLMDTFKRYYDYVAVCICGIPEVTLEGTVADWQEIERRVAELPRWGLGFWTEHLAAVCRQFTRARRGDVDLEHWRAIYKLRDAYGAQLVNGWIGLLFPYIERGSEGARNPALAAEPGSYRQIAELPDDNVGWQGIDPGEPFAATWLTTSDFPTGLVSVPLHLRQRTHGAAEQDHIHDLIAGLVGIEQRELALRPCVGWAVMPAVGVVQALERLGDMVRPLPRRSRQLGKAEFFEGLPADVAQFCDIYDGAIITADPVEAPTPDPIDPDPINPVVRHADPGRRLEILPKREMRNHHVVPSENDPLGSYGGLVLRIADLDDGFLAIAHSGDTWLVVRWKEPVTRLPGPGSKLGRALKLGDTGLGGARKGSFQVVARSFTHLLELIHEHRDPRFFEQPEIQPLEVWSDVTVK